MTKTYTLAEQKENRKKWVKALRSGEYEQGLARLRTKTDKFCCLGVLCDVAGIKAVPNNKHDRVLDYIFEGETNTAPESAMEFVGLRNSGGDYAETRVDDGYAQSLWRLNDQDKLTFSEIADIIESEPKGLFRESLEDA